MAGGRTEERLTRRRTLSLSDGALAGCTDIGLGGEGGEQEGGGENGETEMTVAMRATAVRVVGTNRKAGSKKATVATEG